MPGLQGQDRQNSVQTVLCSYLVIGVSTYDTVSKLLQIQNIPFPEVVAY